MAKLSRNLKALIRQKFQDGNSIWRGYLFDYAKARNLPNLTDGFPRFAADFWLR